MRSTCEEYDNIFSGIRNAAKFAGYADDRELPWLHWPSQLFGKGFFCQVFVPVLPGQSSSTPWMLQSLLKESAGSSGSNLHLILCHSPVGSTFRIRGRKFPVVALIGVPSGARALPVHLDIRSQALISCMVLDVFHAWPRDALVGVADRFLVVLAERNIPNEELKRLQYGKGAP